MSRVASIWMGLLKAGAVALVLALFGVATASAHAHHDVPNPIAGAQYHAAAVLTVDCHGQQASPSTSDDHATHTAIHGGPAHNAPGQGSGHDCCKDVCRCPVACAAHVVMGVAVQVSRRTQPFAVSVLLPGRTVDPTGLDTPPDPRPPLSI